MSDQDVLGRQPPPTPIRWQSWPLRDSGVRTLLVLLGLLVAAVVVRWTTGRTILALVALLALIAALWRYFLPVEFELSQQGVDQWVFGRRRRISWKAVRRYEEYPAGVLLLPHEDRSAMAAFGGLFLPFKTHRDEILAHLRQYTGRG